MLEVIAVPLPKVESTYDIRGLEESELSAILHCLKHCSGGHDPVVTRPDGVSVAGQLYNRLASRASAASPTRF